MSTEANISLQVAKRGVMAAKEIGLKYDIFLNNAELVTEGKKKLRVTLNHPRQANNALHFGIIDQKRYQQLMDRFSGKSEINSDRLSRFESYVKKTGFLQSLPSEASSKGKVSRKRLVPEPGYFVTNLSQLTDDQLGEYAVAFSKSPSFDFVKKYMFIRLQNLYETAILYDSNIELEKLEAEARFLSSLRKWSSTNYAEAVADVIRFLINLDFKERAERIHYLRTLQSVQPIVKQVKIGDFVISSNHTNRIIFLSPWSFDYVRLPLEDLRRNAMSIQKCQKSIFRKIFDFFH